MQNVLIDLYLAALSQQMSYLWHICLLFLLIKCRNGGPRWRSIRVSWARSGCCSWLWLQSFKVCVRPVVLLETRLRKARKCVFIAVGWVGIDSKHIPFFFFLTKHFFFPKCWGATQGMEVSPEPLQGGNGWVPRGSSPFPLVGRVSPAFEDV